MHQYAMNTIRILYIHRISTGTTYGLYLQPESRAFEAEIGSAGDPGGASCRQRLEDSFRTALATQGHSFLLFP
ncbi:hypothetical protein BB934_45375 (plasmid) [Microvirga ossetica]|uniref:Uncharacterized protein n=1 Tax=Microvirga ossetica TaxID=1882682 RepID=A0A1B2EZU8_9HYPH|nr:hypothetical protein BB934_45375 [Microvirga ossetica]